MKYSVRRLAGLLKEHRLSIAFAESMTCGAISHKMGSVNGTSNIFKGSVICYDEAVKTGLLRVNKTLINKYTPESQQVTDALAKNLDKVIKADVHAAITGLAAPGGSETVSKPVGTIFCTFKYRKKIFRMRKKISGSPLQIRKKAGDAFCEFIFKTLKKTLQST